MAVSRQALVQHAIFTTLSAHPSLGSAAGWWFENCAHVRFSDPTRSRIPTHIRGVSDPPSTPAPKTVLSGADALRNIKKPFNFYWRPRDPNFEGIDALIRVKNEIQVLQYTRSSSHGSTTNGLEEIRKRMNYKRNVNWHLVLVDPDLSLAESARDSHKLTGGWENTPIYSCQLDLGNMNRKM